MKIVLFNNGEKIKIPDEIADMIGKNILKDSGASKWQVFTDAGKESLLINLNDVSGIYDKSNIL